MIIIVLLYLFQYLRSKACEEIIRVMRTGSAVRFLSIIPRILKLFDSMILEILLLTFETL